MQNCPFCKSNYLSIKKEEWEWGEDAGIRCIQCRDCGACGPIQPYTTQEQNDTIEIVAEKTGWNTSVNQIRKT